MLTAQIEAWDENEIKELIDVHWRELALNQDLVPLMPQWDLYLAHEESGRMTYCTLRKDGQLAGYIIMLVAPGLHYKTCLTAHMDILYVAPDHRDASAKGVLMMMRVLEVELKRRGVQRWFMGTKLHKDIGAVFRRRGFEPVEMMYSKWIGE